MLKIWKWNFNKEESNQNVKQIRRLYFSNSLPLSPAKFYYYNVFLHICYNFSEQNCLDKPVFNNVSRLNHSSPMNNTGTNKIKRFPQLFVLGPQISLKWRWHYFLFWSIISIKIDIYAYKCKHDYISRGLWQTICLVTMNIWLNFLLEITPSPLASNFDVIF